MTAKLDPPFCFCQKVATIQLDRGRTIYECHHAPITGLSVPCRRERAPTQEHFASSEQEAEQGKSQGERQGRKQEKEQCNEPYTGKHHDLDAHLHSPSRTPHEKSTQLQAAVDNQGSDVIPGCEGLLVEKDSLQELKKQAYRFFHPKSSQTTGQGNHNKADTITHITDSAKFQTNTGGAKVCGFHMHLSEWIMCLRLLWKAEHLRVDSLLRLKDTKADEADEANETRRMEQKESDRMDEALTLFSQHHHEIVHKHPTLHSILIALSNGSRCISHMITVGRWLNQSQSIGNPGHHASVLPRCYCGQPMLATTFRAGFEPEELYVCRVRRSGEGGCARVIRVQEAMLRAYMSISKTPICPIIVTTPTTTPAPERRVRPALKPLEKDLVEAMSMSAPDVWESIESRCKSEWKPLPNTFANGVSSWTTGDDLLGDDNWSEPISGAAPKVVPACSFRPASRPSWLVAGAFGHKSQKKSQNRSSSNKVIKGARNRGKTKENQSLEEYIDQYECALKPRTVEMDAKMHTIRTASEVFEDSITRLDQRIKVMQLEGLDNPRFECRRCQDGTLDHAIVPCYHLVMCDKCIDVSKECVKCREPIDGVRRVYWG